MADAPRRVGSARRRATISSENTRAPLPATHARALPSAPRAAHSPSLANLAAPHRAAQPSLERPTEFPYKRPAPALPLHSSALSLRKADPNHAWDSQLYLSHRNSLAQPQMALDLPRDQIVRLLLDQLHQLGYSYVPLTPTRSSLPNCPHFYRHTLSPKPFAIRTVVLNRRNSAPLFF